VLGKNDPIFPEEDSELPPEECYHLYTKELEVTSDSLRGSVK
jgi:hypothetical protein